MPAPHDLIAALTGRLIVSVQAYPGEPMRDPDTMRRIAQAAVTGGAVAVRMQGIEDLRAAVPVVGVPVIGLWKDGADGVFITPTLSHALSVAATGVDVVAIDGTRRPRPDGRSLSETVAEFRAAFPSTLVMADCGSLDDAVAADAAGADLVGTTLAGYSGEREKTVGPDLELIGEIAAAGLTAPLVAEGRIHSPDQARQALDAGARTVVVGTAITHPSTITGWFAEALVR